MSPAATSSPQTVTLQAMVLIRSGQIAEAERLFRTLIERGLADAATYVNHGELLRRSREAG